MMSAGGQRLVDHKFVVYERNWTRALALGARGGGEEHRGRRHGPYGHRNRAGDHGQRRPAVAFGGRAAQREWGREERSGWTSGSPASQSRGRRGRERPESTGRCSTERRPGGGDRDGSGERGPPSTVRWHREEEETEAVQEGTSGELGEVQVGGDWRGEGAASRRHPS